MLALRTALSHSRSSVACVDKALRHLSAVRLPGNSATAKGSSSSICTNLSPASPFTSVHPSKQLLLQQQRLHATKTDEYSGQKRVYYGSLTPRMKAVKVFSLTTSIAGLAAQPILLEQGMKIGGTAMAVFMCGFGGFFTFVTPLLLHFITKKYVTELFYNHATDEYTAVTISLLLYKKEIKFRTSDVKVPEVPGMFTSFLVHGKPLFVDPSLFEDPEHYVRIMGFDKPIDFKLDLKETESTDKEEKLIAKETLKK